jgi:hypothetical protein
MFQASWPLAALEFDADWAHLGGRWLRFLDEIWVRRDETTAVAVRLGF